MLWYSGVSSSSSFFIFYFFLFLFFNACGIFVLGEPITSWAG